LNSPFSEKRGRVEAEKGDGRSHKRTAREGNPE